MANWGGYALTFTEAVEKYFKTTGAAQTPWRFFDVYCGIGKFEAFIRNKNQQGE
ncbi:MAG: hypothetical protein LBO77_04295 [Desulfovibrio sp.]|jgi:hypothetical protein|nr:hypothetical protein [Desulfovibrio sp.]